MCHGGCVVCMRRSKSRRRRRSLISERDAIVLSSSLPIPLSLFLSPSLAKTPAADESLHASESANAFVIRVQATTSSCVLLAGTMLDVFSFTMNGQKDGWLSEDIFRFPHISRTIFKELKVL